MLKEQPRQEIQNKHVGLQTGNIQGAKSNQVGGAGYRSRYLSHAKRALYHLSYAPNVDIVLGKNWCYCR